MRTPEHQSKGHIAIMKTEKEYDYDLTPFERIAKEVGVSRQAAYVIQNRAMEKFKRELNKRGLKLSDLIAG